MRPIHRNIILLVAISLVIALVLIWQLDIIDPAAVVEISAHPSKEEDSQGLISKGSGESRSILQLTSSITATTVNPEPSTPTRQIIEPTYTALPTYTASPLPTVTQSPISSATPSPTDVILPAVLQDGIDRTCPDPAPGKPDYQHYYLSGQPWPKPVDNPQEHFWLSKPLPGGGRMLYTDWLPYGYDAGGRYLLHNGVDVADPMGTALLAAADGQVIVAGPDTNLLYGWRCDWYGNLVVLELDQRWGDKPVYILYGHVLNIFVKVGQHVNLGEELAEVGIGGAAGNPHLHFEVRLGTNEFQSTRNPFLWLQPPDTRGIIVGRLIDPQGRPWQGVAITAVGRSEGAENRTSWTYLGDPRQLIKPDEEFAENFVIPDLRPGMYELYVELQEQFYQVPVEIHGGQMVRAEIITEPYKTPTPETPTQPAESPPESPLETSTPQG